MGSRMRGTETLIRKAEIPKGMREREALMVAIVIVRSAVKERCDDEMRGGKPGYSYGFLQYVGFARRMLLGV
jgi:hypothetical protein